MEIILTFLEGVASFVSPCLLPLIPLYISYIIGDEVEGKSIKLIRSIFFVLGFTTIFVSLGVFTASLGRYVYLHKDLINLVFGFFIIILGLNYIGIINIKFLNSTKKFNFKLEKASVFTAFVFGFFFGLGYTPCVGAFLGSALMMASTSGSVLNGVFYLLSYSIGLGLPFVLSAVFFEKVKFIHTFIKQHYKQVNFISGLMLILIGAYKTIEALGGIL